MLIFLRIRALRCTCPTTPVRTARRPTELGAATVNHHNGPFLRAQSSFARVFLIASAHLISSISATYVTQSLYKTALRHRVAQWPLVTPSLLVDSQTLSDARSIRHPDPRGCSGTQLEFNLNLASVSGQKTVCLRVHAVSLAGPCQRSFVQHPSCLEVSCVCAMASVVAGK
jgi:hypothetical protein